MRHLLALLIAISLGPLTGDPAGIADASADTAADCIHHSADTPHHGGSHHKPDEKPLSCCVGVCFVATVPAPAAVKDGRLHQATGRAADRSGEPRDIAPADPPPRG